MGLDGVDVENDNFCGYRTNGYWQFDHGRFWASLLFVVIWSILKKNIVYLNYISMGTLILNFIFVP